MIERIENLAARLIPHRKWMLITFLIAFIGAMPATFGLMILFKTPIIFFAGMFLLWAGCAWPWVLFLISYWYNPNGGPLTVEKIKTTHPLIRWHAYIIWFFAPVCLVILFLSPFVVLAMFYPFITMMQK
ncbi:hypothetical protein ACFLQL_00940 [Verrucomicrobiota bacterium]